MTDRNNNCRVVNLIYNTFKQTEQEDLQMLTGKRFKVSQYADI
jgi:hypothetical protein